ncbi:hypothetical protein [Clostridium sp. C2-6-12]|uniref:hypothetical protein n=1 Tax=Clostridium sp. C2-6-12 TaxID=2698832 RepID=UPI001370E119|nr:hypothetical protein [Clostridium sp. C2-6-12]
MAVPLNVYFLYKISNMNNESEFLLIKVTKPAWNNSIENEGENAEEILDKKRDEVLVKFTVQNNWTSAELLGQFEGEPEGDSFYEELGGFYIEFWKTKSGYGFPWMVISEAQDEQAFWNIVKNDCFLENSRPLPPAEKIRAKFITEGDYL